MSVGDERDIEAKARCTTACRVHAKLGLCSHDKQSVYSLGGEVGDEGSLMEGIRCPLVDDSFPALGRNSGMNVPIRRPVFERVAPAVQHAGHT